MSGDPAARLHAPTVRDGVHDRVAVEEPLEIRVGGEAIAVTMRTPGHDEELAVGFLFGEGLIRAGGVRGAGPTAAFDNNVVDVDADLAGRPPTRRFFTTSSCGICGKGALEEVAVHSAPVPDGPVVPRALLASLPDRLASAQPAFDLTGGVHATGLFAADGTLLLAREDVGRHNAMDKVIGARVLAGTAPLDGVLLCVSGRVSFELVQKAAVAGAPVLVAVGAPTSLAISLARDRNITLCGFARQGQVNVYTGAERVG